MLWLKLIGGGLLGATMGLMFGLIFELKGKSSYWAIIPAILCVIAVNLLTIG